MNSVPGGPVFALGIAIGLGLFSGIQIATFIGLTGIVVVPVALVIGGVIATVLNGIILFLFQLVLPDWFMTIGKRGNRRRDMRR